MSQERKVEALPKLPLRPAEGHKGMFGRVLVVGGHQEMVGAPVLAGTAALRMGAGLVQIAVPREILTLAISITPELIGLGLGKRVGERRLIEACEVADALVIGPGMGRSRDLANRVLRLVRLEKAMVVDADGLNALAAQKSWPKDFAGRAVLTPHPGEMARLGHFFGRSDVPKDEPGRIEIAIDAAKAIGQVVVLKGHRTVVSDGTRYYVNGTGDSTLSKAGAGDVLSGMIGCLLGQRMAGFEAAVAAVWLHGKAGELAGKKHGTRSALASEVIAEIAAAVGEYEGISGS